MSRNKERDEAILKTVEMIIYSSEYIDEAEISIRIARGEVTTVRYNVNELIITDDTITDDVKSKEEVNRW